jgi:hypothetical protein
MGGFIRTNAGIEQLGFVRGPARLLAAPVSTAPPATIADIIRLSGTETNEVQTITTTGTPTGGTFRLSFRGVQTAALAHTSTSAQVQAALEALSTIGTGNVTCTGGPLPTGVVVTFVGLLAGSNWPMIALANNSLTGGTTPTVVIAETTPGVGFFDPVGAWFDLGATKNGVNPTMNNTEEEFTIDQSKTAIGVLPNEWTWGLTTSLVEVTLENLTLAWDMGPVTLNTTPTVPEKKSGMGDPDGYTVRRLAVIHRRPTTQGSLLRVHFFRKMIRQAAESTLGYAATGDQQSVAFNMRALRDDNVSDPYQTIGYMLDQVA